jgi:hypothetical protein
VVTVTTSGLATAVTNGSAQITAKSESLSASVTVSVAQAAAQLIKVSGDAQTDTAGQTLPQPLVVQVNDATGHAVAGVTVGFAATAGSGSTGSASATTNASGQAQTTWTLGQTTGTQTARATVGALPVLSFTATATGSTTPPTLVASGLPSALYVTAPPGDTNRIVVQQTGIIRVVFAIRAHAAVPGSPDHQRVNVACEPAFHPTSHQRLLTSITGSNGA